ncbi:MAG: hypothetical protein RMJ37_05465 [Spirochaetia bacterium]|nr:hypothetical protein [Spirochaetota bacterium]MCX8096431.1 hypothetical protein [Spirochaetota bacterium]MDW8112765.1 hypothetical protein [Spirochaetia bacterium]
MERVNLSPNINSNIVSNLVPEPNNRRETNNRQPQPQETREVIVDINFRQQNSEEMRNMASTFERVGDTYQRMDRLESAITAYQTSFSINPNPDVVQKVDDLAARISSEGKL